MTAKLSITMEQSGLSFSLYIVITSTVTAVTATAYFLPDLQNTTQNRQTMDNKMKVKQQ